MEETVIYALIDPRSDQVRYIGKANDPVCRLMQHLMPSALSARTHKAAWLRKLVGKGLKPCVIPLEYVSRDNWQVCEMKWIAFFRARGDGLTNGSDGGEGTVGVVRSPETLERMAEAQRGKVLSEETRRKISVSNKGQKRHPSFGKRLSKALRGRVRTPEHCLAISNGKKGKKPSPESTKKRVATVTGMKYKPRSEEMKKPHRIAAERRWAASGQTVLPRACLNCELVFKPKDSNKNRLYCSQACYHNHRRIQHEKSKFIER